MARNKKVATISAPSPSPINTPFLSLDDIERKSFEFIGSAYIKSLEGRVNYRPVGVDKMEEFLKGSVDGGVDKLPAMAKFVSDILCNEDGTDYITFERARKLPFEVLDSIIGDVAEARKENRKNA